MWGLGFRVKGLRFKVLGLRFEISDIRFEVSDFRFCACILLAAASSRVQGLGFEVKRNQG